MLAKAAARSTKNIVPNREYAPSNSSPSEAEPASTAAKRMLVTPAAVARRVAADTIASEMSMPIASPSGATRRASSTVVVPGPQPMSSTRHPG